MRYRSRVAGLLSLVVPPVLGAQTPASRTSVPAVVSAEQFRSLQWVFGRWRGLGVGRLSAVGAFYEEYGIANDSTAWMRTYSDSTFSKVTDSTRFELRRGTLTAVPARGTPRVAEHVSRDSVHWGGNGVAYVRVNDDVWRAFFPLRSPDGTQAYYELRRIPVRR